MTTETEVQNAPNLQTALVAIARTLDRVVGLLARPAATEDSWSDWRPAEEVREAISVTDDDIVEFKAVSQERQTSRRIYARGALKLGDDELIDAYAKAGPLWLHAYDRKLVMGYPAEIKRAMVEDVEATDPQAAADLARDILKVPTSGGVLEGVNVGG